MGEVAGALYGLETLIEGAVAAAKGMYDPTLPLKATLVPIEDVNLPRCYHTVSVIKGRAYIFGGKTVNEHGVETLTDNDMHIIVLPSSGIESTDYRRIESGINGPPPRFGHSAAAVDDQIYIYGGYGQTQNTLSDTPGVVWTYDTTLNRWSKLEPSRESPLPSDRTYHAATAFDHPRETAPRTYQGTMPQRPPDPARADVLPEPQAADTYGTLIIHGGMTVEGQRLLSDVFAFDIGSRMWSEMPSGPLTVTKTASPSLTSVANRLYTLSDGQTHYMDLAKSTFSDKGGMGELGLIPMGPWCPMKSNFDSHDSGPGERTGAALVPVNTGQERQYLLEIGGESSSGSSQTFGDVWALQLTLEGMTAASFKDAARMAIKKSTGEEQWAEVRYYGADGVMFQEGQDGRGIGKRRGFAACAATEVDGCSVLVWGGQDESGRALGDGVMITVDR